MWGTETEKASFAGLHPLFYGSQDGRDYAKGIKTIKKLAEGGYVPAICELGLACFDSPDFSFSVCFLAKSWRFDEKGMLFVSEKHTFFIALILRDFSAP